MTTKRVSEYASQLAQDGAISSEAAAILGRDDREATAAPLGHVAGEPVFFLVAIDASGSMEPFRDEVINSHRFMLDPLRESAKCRMRSLFVSQYTFAEQPKPLSEVTKLSADGRDSVALLDHANYVPDGRTALYKTIYQLCQEMAADLDSCYVSGFAASFDIAVITDGKDNIGGVDLNDLRLLINDFRGRGHLRSAAVLGLISKEFSKENLEAIRAALGFDQAVSLTRDPREIRRAFVLASQFSSVAPRN